MKKTIIGLISLLMLSMTGTAGATPYSSVVDFSTSGTYNGQNYIEISDSNSSGFVGIYSHTVTFDPAAASVESALLTINYANAYGLLGNGNAKEIWFINNNVGTQIGSLGTYNDTNWHAKTFDLNSYISGVSGTTWSIAFKFNETTNGDDTFYLDKSTLSGEYTEVANNADPVPEPGTMVLLGFGMLGLAIYGKRRMNN